MKGRIMPKWIMLLAAIYVIAFPARAQMYFSDDFENPAQSESKWEVISGVWEVGDGVYHQTDTSDPWLVSMISKDHWKDEWTEYTIEFKVKPLTAGDAPVNILFRVQEPVPQVWADRQGAETHMYRWIINGWTNTESRPYMYSEGQTVMLAQTNNSLEVGDWHDIKLVVTNSGCSGFVNGEQMFDVEHAEWTDGRVGLHAYSGQMDFDDLVIYGSAGTAVTPSGKMGVTWGEVKVNKQ